MGIATLAAMWVASSLMLRSAAVRSQSGILAACDYKDLATAEVHGVSGGVDVSFCGKSVTLRESGSAADPFAGVTWWDASHQGEKLTKQESKTLKNHVGSYWRYGRSVAQLGKGLLPPLYKEDYNTDFKDDNYASLVRSVLGFTVTLADAANKLPAPAACTDAWLGDWIPKEALELLRLKKETGRTTSFPWFQSPTFDESHSYQFLTEKEQPSSCKPVCLQQNISFPVQFHFRTRHGKDVAKYDTKEKPMLVLPNLAFKVADVSEVITDPLYVMSTAELVQWLNTTHPYKSFQERAGQTFGPYPRLAKEVQRRRMDGKGFSAWEVKGDGEGKYEMLEVSGAEYRPFFDALSSRFDMPPRPGLWGQVSNEDPYIIKVTLEDPEGCD
ncbi:clpC [Symbiodinium natans]|uniref:ClpC protein n=2 Tax=Symbiodinium natans TaxID=878477 RepID=A0A812N5A3_9DINO|nr:clpC [Symbiodinium natans]